MKALVKYQKGKGNMELRDIPEPFPSDDQIKIEVKAAGICGSDIHIYNDTISMPMKLPVVPGHELVGVIVDTGKKVTNWNAGDRIIAEDTYSSCGNCMYCLKGLYNLCSQRKCLGYWYNGGFEKYTVVPEERIHKLPDNLDFVEATLIQPLSCAVHAIEELIKIKNNDVILITGPGVIGLSCLQVLKTYNTTVIVAGTDKDKNRLDIARKIGADITVNIMEEDLFEAINALTNNNGADFVFECSGSEKAILDDLEVIKKSGKFIQVGISPKPVCLDFSKICFKEIQIIGTLGAKKSSWEKAIEFVSSGKIQLKPLISGVFTLDNWKEAFGKAEKKDGVKQVLIPD